MDLKRVAIFCNPYSGTGRDRVLELTRQACACLSPQASEVLTGPGDMGAVVCSGDKVRVLGQDSTGTRRDTIETAGQMVAAGAELLVIVSGDGTYNDALEGMKSLGTTVPIFGIAAGSFNVMFPKRVHDPFVSMRGDFRPFSLKDLVVEDVPGLVSRINGEIVSYGFFWANVSNVVGHQGPDGDIVLIDAREYIRGDVVPITTPLPVATEETAIDLSSETLGEIRLGEGAGIASPVVAQCVPEINQIMSGGFGAIAEATGFHGVAFYYEDAGFAFLPGPEDFPVNTRSLAFYEGDQVRFTNLRDQSVLCVDSTAVVPLRSTDVLTVEVVLDLGKKAVLPRR